MRAWRDIQKGRNLHSLTLAEYNYPFFNNLLARIRDLKSFSRQRECGFDSHPGHHIKIPASIVFLSVLVNITSTVLVEGLFSNGTFNLQLFLSVVIDMLIEPNLAVRLQTG